MPNNGIGCMDGSAMAFPKHMAICLWKMDRAQVCNGYAHCLTQRTRAGKLAGFVTSCLAVSPMGMPSASPSWHSLKVRWWTTPTNKIFIDLGTPHEILWLFRISQTPSRSVTVFVNGLQF